MTNEALRQCNAAGLDFAQTFRFHYVVSHANLGLPGFLRRDFAGLVLQTGPGLEVRALRDEAGFPIGHVIGVAVDHAGQVWGEQPLAGVSARSPEFFRTFEECLRFVVGRFAVVVAARTEARFYTDATGTIGAVYSRAHDRISSNPLLCLDRPVEENPLFDHDDIRAGLCAPGLLMTADREVMRMNPSCFLRLSDLTEERFWPRDGLFEAGPADHDGMLDEIVSAGRAVMGRLIRRHPVALSMSGGNDSRVVFALAGPALAGVAQAFSHVNNYAGRRDAAIAARLCGLRGINHEVHDRKTTRLAADALARMAAAARIAGGLDAPPPAEVANGLVSHIRPGALVLRGHQTNHLRAQYLVSADPRTWDDPAWQIRLMHLTSRADRRRGGTARFLDQFAAIRAGQSDNARLRSAEIMFIETLIPAALGRLFPAMTHNFYLSPYNSRRLIELSLSFDTAMRMANDATMDVLARAMPDVVAVPMTPELDPDLACDRPKEDYFVRMARFNDRRVTAGAARPQRVPSRVRA